MLYGGGIHLVFHLEHHRHILVALHIVAENEIALAVLHHRIVLLKACLGIQAHASCLLELYGAMLFESLTDHFR